MTRSLRFRDIIAPQRKVAPLGWRTGPVLASQLYADASENARETVTE